jgi:hypothetical protein
VFILAVISLHTHLTPSIRFEQFNYIADFHAFDAAFPSTLIFCPHSYCIVFYLIIKSIFNEFREMLEKIDDDPSRSANPLWLSLRVCVKG